MFLIPISSTKFVGNESVKIQFMVILKSHNHKKALFL